MVRKDREGRQFTFWIKPELDRALEEFAARASVTKTDAIEAALWALLRAEPREAGQAFAEKVERRLAAGLSSNPR